MGKGHPSVKANSICRWNYWGSLVWILVYWCTRSTTDHIFCIRQILDKKWEYSEAVHQLFIDFKKAYDSVGRKVLYNILTEFGIPIKLIRLIKMCLNEAYGRVQVGKHLSYMFPIMNSLKRDVLLPLLFNCALEMPLGGFRQTRRAWNLTVCISFRYTLMMLIYWVEASIL
jgi:hypothetical protein